MGWQQLELKDRWSVITSGVQAFATLGTFVVALVGIWKVAPIITYQVQQQQSEAAVAQSVPGGEQVTEPLVVDALDWWGGEVQGFRRIIALTHSPVQQGSKVSFEIQRGEGTAIVPGAKPDLLVVTATDARGKKEVVSVAVNENATLPSQYVRFRLNQGAFANLPEAERRKVESAVERYINRDMVPKVPPVMVRADMSLKQLHEDVTMNQHHREEALRHIIGLEEVISSARQTR